MTGIKRIGMVAYMVERFMEYGHGLILEEYGTWKDLLSEAGVDPNSLKTMGRIYCSCKKTKHSS